MITLDWNKVVIAVLEIFLLSLLLGGLGLGIISFYPGFFVPGGFLYWIATAVMAALYIFGFVVILWGVSSLTPEQSKETFRRLLSYFGRPNLDRRKHQ